jgi:hypothetical protein
MDESGTPLEQALHEASAEIESAYERFYRELLKTELLIPSREQMFPLTHQPPYPNELISFLGIQAGDRAMVPAFTRESLVQEWTGHEFTLRRMTLERLLAALPDSWWVVINPGSLAEKELSPWELALLKSGEEAIPEILSELSRLDPVQSISLTLLEPNEQAEVKAVLTNEAKNIPELRRLFLLKESGINLDQQQMTFLVLGVDTDFVTPARLEAIQDQLKRVVDPLLIGAESLRMRAGQGAHGTLMLGVFRDTEPFYERRASGFAGWMERLFGKAAPVAKPS